MANSGVLLRMRCLYNISQQRVKSKLNQLVETIDGLWTGIPAHTRPGSSNATMKSIPPPPPPQSTVNLL